MKITVLLYILTLFQVSDTPDHIGTRSINTDYFWNNDRNLRLLKSKTNILIDSIKRGYYGDKEYLTFKDKKLSGIKYLKNGKINFVSTIVDGKGYLVNNDDTIYIDDGKLNGKSFFHSFYLAKQRPLQTKGELSKAGEKYIMNFKDNFLKSMLVYREGILIYEAYYSKYDFIKENRDLVKSEFKFQDSILKVFNADGSIRRSTKYKNGKIIK
ncbi:MAG: hypothetical protein JNJ41_11865 [Bacteroidia bacterium]|nr:hypothetical protein [Bacteroidia bacterium]